jgi:vacuolar-type H+-ATPase subunit I/STV1
MLSDFIKEKAREISYALIRVSFYVKRPELRSKLDVLAIELLEDSAKASVDFGLENINRALADISALDALVRLAHSIYEIEPVNATILVRELDSLNSAIRQFGNFSATATTRQAGSEQELPNLETLFQSKLNTSISSNSIVQQPGSKIPASLSEDLNKSEDLNNALEQSENNGNSAINTAIRQSAIVNRIRSGNSKGCRLKNLITEFPDVSERTLRYDLKRLCEQGTIERVGNGGPASYYRLR